MMKVNARLKCVHFDLGLGLDFATAGLDYISKAITPYPGCDGRLWFFQEVPQPATSPNDTSSTAMFVLVQRLTQRLGLTFDVVVDAISTFRVAVLTARLDEQLVHTPVVKVVGERQCADLVNEVQLAGAVKLDDGTERARMSVEEVLRPSSARNLDARYVIAEIHDVGE